jgi:hypothetical protein
MADITDDDLLSVKQYNLIAALLAESSVRKACEVAGVRERTAYNWLKNPTFVDAYRAARREAVSQAISRLQQFSATLAGELLRLAVQGRSEAVRLGAASKGLDLALRSVEIDDLQARLEALERAYAEKL